MNFLLESTLDSTSPVDGYLFRKENTMSTTIETRIASLETRIESLILAVANKDTNSATVCVKSCKDHLTDLVDEIIVSGVALSQAAWSALEAAVAAVCSMWHFVCDAASWCWNKVRALAAAIVAAFSNVCAWASQKTAPAVTPAPVPVPAP